MFAESLPVKVLCWVLALSVPAIFVLGWPVFSPGEVLCGSDTMTPGDICRSGPMYGSGPDASYAEMSAEMAWRRAVAYLAIALSVASILGIAALGIVRRRRALDSRTLTPDTWLDGITGHGATDAQLAAARLTCLIRVDRRERRHGSADPEALTWRFRWAGVEVLRGGTQEAADLYRQVATARADALGDRLGVLEAELGTAYADVVGGNLGPALDVCDDVQERAGHLLPGGHPLFATIGRIRQRAERLTR